MGSELTLIRQVQRPAALNHKQGRLILHLRAKTLQPEAAAGERPGERHELISACRCTSVATGGDHTIGMAIEARHEAAAKHDSVAHVVAAGPGAFGITDRVEQGTPLRGECVAEEAIER